MKFELTDETKKLCSLTLHRIKAVKDFGDVKKGDLGGWVEKEENLSQDGYCWVRGDARVSGDARVRGDARVFGDAQVFGDARVFDDAQVYGDAQVFGNAEVYGDAQVYGNAWVFDNAQVHGNAEVSGNAKVSGNAEVSGDARVRGRKDLLVIDSIGPEDGALSAVKQSDGSIAINRGCFRGSLDEFEEAVKKRHGDNIHAQIYLALIPVIKLRLTQ